jgi:hypothetical protein
MTSFILHPCSAFSNIFSDNTINNLEAVLHDVRMKNKNYNNQAKGSWHLELHQWYPSSPPRQ